MKLRRTLLLILSLTALGVGDVPLAAGAAVGAPLSGAAVSMDQAVKMVESRFHARVVKAEAQRDNGRTVYVLRLLSDSGKVWTVHVDATSGSVQ